MLDVDGMVLRFVKPSIHGLFLRNPPPPLSLSLSLALSALAESKLSSLYMSYCHSERINSRLISENSGTLLMGGPTVLPQRPHDYAIKIPSVYAHQRNSYLSVAVRRSMRIRKKNVYCAEAKRKFSERVSKTNFGFGVSPPLN